jgi:hypothetical protein
MTLSAALMRTPGDRFWSMQNEHESIIPCFLVSCSLRSRLREAARLTLCSLDALLAVRAARRSVSERAP